MSDVTIPGVTSSYNTDSIVSKLMELERIPLERKQDELDKYENEKTVWQDISRNISKVEDAAKKLYGFENPFSERIAESSDEDVLTATVGRDAIEEQKTIKIINMAASDRFLSDSMDKDFDAPDGTYSFTIGEEEISFNFRGGSLSRLADRINSRGRDLLHAQVIKDTPDTSVILIESTKEGLENRLIFNEGTALDFAVSAGVLKRSDSSMRNIALTPEEAGTLFKLDEKNNLVLQPGAQGSIPVNPSVKDNGKMVLEITFTVNEMEQGEWTPPTPPTGPDELTPGSISFKGITISNSNSTVEMPQYQEPEPPEVIDDFEVFSLVADGKETILPGFRKTSEEQTITINLRDAAGAADAIKFFNKNTFREISISDIKIYDPDARGEWEPARPVSTASDAKIKIDGIEVRRTSNTIDDLIPGVTLNINGESDKAVKLDIKPDRELIKDTIIEFVGNYNRLQAELGILVSNDGGLISEIDYFSDEEKKTARERLGLFQGDSTLNQMKSRLQYIMMEPYTTSAGDNLKLLSQIGISTNSSGFGGGINNSKLRGYIEINENDLDSALTENLVAVKELFGIDSDGDLVVDNGAAYKTQEYTKPYTGTGGIVAYRISSLDSRITRTERDIASYELKLEDKEAELKNKYAIMEGNINSMQQSSNALNNLNNNNN